MINRVLIRIKVVQILYSYLLVEKQFSIERIPELPTREKRFAYSLYMDMLVLMLRISRLISRRGGSCPLADTRFIKRVASDEQVKSLMARYRSARFPFDSVEDALADKIKNSSLYKNFLKRSEAGEPGVEEGIWRDIYNIFIMPDQSVNDIIAVRENYTLKGQERMQEMLATTFVNFMESQDDSAEAAKALSVSLDKARELYFRLLLLAVELTDMQERILDENRHKFLATEEDLNPNMKFVENEFVNDLRNDETFRNFIEKNKLTWLPEEHVMMETLLRNIKESDIYKEYMAAPISDRRRDYEFWRNLYKRVILGSEALLETLEDKSVFWNDDLDIMGTFVVKTIKRFEDTNHHALLDKFKDEEDARFGFDLIKYVLKNKDEYRRYIDEALLQQYWDRDRLAFMDVLVIETALAEILNFPKIPLNVSINEYVEIAKCYSTGKSGAFVNGLLAAVLRRLHDDGKLHK